MREVGLWIIARGSGSAVWRVELTIITPTPPLFCVNAVDKGVSGSFGVNAVDKGLTVPLGVPSASLRGKKAVDKGVRGRGVCRDTFGAGERRGLQIGDTRSDQAKGYRIRNYLSNKNKARIRLGLRNAWVLAAYDLGREDLVAESSTNVANNAGVGVSHVNAGVCDHNPRSRQHSPLYEVIWDKAVDDNRKS